MGWSAVENASSPPLVGSSIDASRGAYVFVRTGEEVDRRLAAELPSVVHGHSLKDLPAKLAACPKPKAHLTD